MISALFLSTSSAQDLNGFLHFWATSFVLRTIASMNLDGAEEKSSGSSEHRA